MSEPKTKTIDMEDAQLMFIECVYPHVNEDHYVDFPDHWWDELDDFMKNRGYQLCRQDDEYVYIGE